MRRSNITDVLTGPARLLAADGTELPNGAVLTREEAQTLVERIVKMSKAEGIDVQIGGGYNTNVRFADNQMSTAGGVSDFSVGVQSWFGPKHAVVTTNEITDE